MLIPFLIDSIFNNIAVMVFGVKGCHRLLISDFADDHLLRVSAFSQ